MIGEEKMEILNKIAFGIGFIGMVVIAWGVLLVVLEFLRSEYFELKQKKDRNKDKHLLRQHLGSYILLGLEFMIAGDIIHTILRPDKESLIVLGSIVAIRTVISYFLQLELKSKI